MSACVRDPLEIECPSVSVGQLVISEIRQGGQLNGDTYGQWIEIYNATGVAVDLFGAELLIRRLDGGSEGRILVRTDNVTVPANGYVVIGSFPADMLPEHVNYGYRLDFDSDLYDDAAIDLDSCGVQIDRVVYHDLTGIGTLALDGAADPDATTNDDEGSWCVDDRDTMPDPTMLGIPGTPGERNPSCGP